MSASRPEPVAIRRGYVGIPDGQIHLRRCDGPGTPLVMLHQTASSGAMFEAMMRRMAGTRPLLALDTPGFGGSFDPAAPPSLGDYREWLLAALDALGIGRCHLLGHHTGGCIALELAVAAPARVASLAIIGPVFLTPVEREQYRARYFQPFAPRWDAGHLRQAWDYVQALGSTPDLALQHRETVDSLRAWSARGDAYNAVWDSDQAALLPRVRCPLLLAAAPDDVLAPCLERALRARPDARTAPLAGANFEPDLDPDGCVAAMTAFLAGLPEDDAQALNRPR
jgi:pimeloyl-ACP methyl ester carboxylesterase